MFIKSLEEKMVKYQDLLPIETKENREPFTVLRDNELPNAYAKGMNDMQSFFKGKILLRNTVYEKVKTAQKRLQARCPNFSLKVTYGYRSLEIQTKRFLQELCAVSKKRFFSNPLDLYEEVHRRIAVPTVAGHPTGGAVDIVIISGDGLMIDFGSKLYDFSTKKTYTFMPVSKKARQNRFLMRSLMLEQGFAPFDGEWWHFSYGDREWAYFYKKKAIYGQVDISDMRFD